VIDGVQIVPLKVFKDDRGAVMHMLRADAPHFIAFGEIYFSTVNQGKVKGWRRHKRMTQNLAVPSGCVQIVLYDGRQQSPTFGEVQNLKFGPDAIYALACVPPGVWSAFKGIAEGASVVANCATIGHEPDEGETRSLADPPVAFDWA
jgi:dTDP-4-dehydrorhamnose 3,5-epimerase